MRKSSGLSLKECGTCDLLKLKKYLEFSNFEHYDVQKWQNGK